MGKMLDVEYSLWGLANATNGEGRFFTGLRDRLTGGDGALAKLTEIRDALPASHEVAQRATMILDAIDAGAFQPNNRNALRAMAGQVQQIAKWINGKPREELSALDATLTELDGLLPAPSSYMGTVPSGS